MTRRKSAQLFAEACRLFPGGVNSPVRAFGAVGGEPVFFELGQGAYLQDVDANRYLDFVLSWGPLILGHANPRVAQAVADAAALGTSFGAPHAGEIELARAIQGFMPNLERLRFVNSGTEATMSAIRLARAATGRAKVVKFEGCYHGHVDTLLAKAGSGVVTLGLPDSPGITAAAAAETLVVPFNDAGAVAEVFNRFPDEVAAVMVEPVAGNMGVIPPAHGFLRDLRDTTRRHGALLIFDEVMTGFRVHPGGAQTLFEIEPDLTTLGKVIGGGLPVGAYGGRADLMDQVAPAGSVYQAGTLSGNPVAMAAGIATLEQLRVPGAWDKIEATTAAVAQAIAEAAAEAQIPVCQGRVGTMFSTFFTARPVTEWASASRSDRERYASFFWSMLRNGVYLPPSPFEACFVSLAHGTGEVDLTRQAATRALAAVANDSRR